MRHVPEEDTVVRNTYEKICHLKDGENGKRRDKERDAKRQETGMFLFLFLNHNSSVKFPGLLTVPTPNSLTGVSRICVS